PVIVAVHDGARFVGEGIESVLCQTAADLELVIVDDASTDHTPVLVDAVSDARLVVLRNDEQRGLAVSLNRGLDEASGRYVARLDADDIASPERLERQLARIRAEPSIGVLGTAVIDLDAEGRLGGAHRLPRGATAVRW